MRKMKWLIKISFSMLDAERAARTDSKFLQKLGYKSMNTENKCNCSVSTSSKIKLTNVNTRNLTD